MVAPRAVLPFFVVIAVAAFIVACGSSAPKYSGSSEEALSESSTGEADAAQGRGRVAYERAPSREVETAGWMDNPSPAYILNGAPARAAETAKDVFSRNVSQAPSQAPSKPSPAGPRMVHHEASAVLRSTEPEKTIDSAIALARRAGGYLQRRYTNQVELRVPSKDFDSSFARLMRLAEVVSYTVGAEDITEFYQDADLRLRVVVSTLQRLEALVKQAKTESQKMMLLERLRQLREEKEVLEARKRELSALARFATITLTVQGHDPAVADAFRKDLAEFLWIHRLDPFNDGRFAGRKTMKLKAPQGMAVTSKGRPWRATGAKGSELWASKMSVLPRGDSRFWSEAVRERLQGGYKSVDTSEAGGFRFCRFRSRGPTPYYYWVGVRARGDDLDLVEIYFPTEELQDTQLASVLACVQGAAE